MTLEALLSQTNLFMLVFSRMLGLFVTAPVWSNQMVPVQIRVALGLVLGLLVMPLTDPVTLPDTLIELMPLVVKELFVGMVIGFVAMLIFAAINLAGEFLDIDMGLAMTNVLDPMSGQQMPLVGNFKYLLALLIYMAVGGHHALIVAAVQSYAVIPLAGATLGPEVTGALMDVAAGIFVTALKIAAPIMAALFLTTVALGVINRAVPQMNVFIVGMPVKLGVGVIMLAVGLPFYIAFLEVLFDSLSGQVSQILLLLGG